MPDYSIGPSSHYYDDADIAPDVPDYPEEWTSDQRVSAYWYALGHGIKVRSTNAWHAVLADAERTAERHQHKVASARDQT